MPTLTIYDSEGNEYSPTGNATGTNQQIKNLNLASVRFAVLPGRQTRFLAYYRAKETEHGRAEQFYAEYTTRESSNSANAFIDAIKNQVDEWGHTLDETADEMAVFQTVQNAARTTAPGSKNDRTILNELLSGRQLVTVGVSDAEAALGLMQSFDGSHSVAITDSQNADSLDGFDLAIVMGRHRGIEPLGSTVDRWEQTKQSLKTQLVNEEINQIKQSVQTLKQEHGLSSSEIRSRVSRKVPALSSSSSGGSNQFSGSQNDSITGKLLSPQVGKYVFFGSLILLVLLAAGWGVAAFGLLPGGEGGNETAISGTVYDSEGEPLGSQAVRLSGDTLDNDTQTETSESRWFGFVGDPGEYEFTGLDDGEYTVRVVDSEHDYEPQSAQPGDTVDFGEPAGSETEGNGNDGADGTDDESAGDDEETDDANTNGDDSEETTENNSDESPQADVSGTINRAPDENLPGETTVTLSDGDEFILTAFANDGQVDGESNEGAELDRFSGSASFADIPHDEYTVEVTADGHEPDSQAITVTEETDEFELELIEYSSLTLTVVDESDTDQTLEGADITLTGEDGDEVDSGASDQDGQFTAESLPPQQYTVAVSLEEYEDAEVEIELEPGEDREDETIELTAS